MMPDNRSIKELRKTTEKLIDFINLLPEKTFRISFQGKWSPREVLIHIVFWHENFSLNTETLARGESPKYASGTFSELNAKAVLKNMDSSKESLISRLKNAQQRLESLSKSKKVLSTSLSFKDKGKVWNYSNALDRMEKHIRGHLERLKNIYPHSIRK